MKKQIEEMAIVLAKVNCKPEGCGYCYLEYGTLENSCEEYLVYKKMAEALYNAGYRKEIKAQWVHNEDHGAYESPYFCSNCLADGSSDTDGEHYCYSCGARMVNAKYRKPR